MKLNTGKIVLLFSVATLPLSVLANDVYKNNPFIKPSKRVEEVKEVNTCDLSSIEEIVNQRIAELMPPEEDSVKVVNLKPQREMSNLERIKASGAQPVSHINGIDVYFDKEDGVFMYDKKIKSNTKG